MQDRQAKTLRGLTWKHDRGLAPLLATASDFCQKHPEVKIQWETRSLQEFGEGAIQAVADDYDLVIIDHPYMGLVAREKCFLPLDKHFTPDELNELSRDSVGQSYPSYCFEGHQWALPVDAAAQVAGYRADLLQANGFSVPQTWEEVAELAKFRRRSEEHTSELQSPCISYAVFCLKKKKNDVGNTQHISAKSLLSHSQPLSDISGLNDVCNYRS